MWIEWLDASECGEQNQGPLGSLYMDSMARPLPGAVVGRAVAMWIEWLAPAAQELWRRAIGTSDA